MVRAKKNAPLESVISSFAESLSQLILILFMFAISLFAP